MITVISPAKNLDYETPPATDKFTQPELLEHSEELMKVCRELTPAQIGSLMKISDKLSGLNAARFSEWAQPFTQSNAKQAALAFNGDVYGGLDASTLKASELDYAQNHLRILSGLYGLLKPLDLMQAYRLEMGTKLENSRGKNLYEFWGSVIANKLNEVLNAQIITPHFKDCKNGQYKVISFYAKKARGMMARYIIENKVTQLSQLKEFTVAGYYFSPEATAKELEPVFMRDEQN